MTSRHWLARRAQAARELIWRPLWRPARRAALAAAAELGSVVLPPWRCPACRHWKTRRRLARCTGVVQGSVWRQRVFATGCPRCGLLYASPRPRAVELDELYAEAGEWSESHPGSERVPMVARKLVLAVDRLTGVCTPAPGSAALDFGCGHGRWLNALAGHGWATFGIDPATKTAFERHTELHEIPRVPRFQLVIASHVLEHVTSPGQVLSALGQATAAGGWIYVSVPNLDRLPDHGGWRYVLNGKAHIAAYSFDCLRVLLQHAGFGDVTPVELPDETEKGRTRLRVVARRDGAASVVSHPLKAAIQAMERAGVRVAGSARAQCDTILAWPRRPSATRHGA